MNCSIYYIYIVLYHIRQRNYRRRMNVGYLPFVMMPIFGASIHIIQKLLFECSLEIADESIKFQKPYIFTWLCSFGVFLTFIFHVSSDMRSFKNKFLTSKKYLRPFSMLFISTFLNLLSGILSNVSSLYLNYSVSLMLRSSTVIFGALIATYYLKKPIQRYQKCGVALTLISIILVSIAAAFSGSTTTHREASTGVSLIFILVRTLSKSLQAIAFIIEESVMRTYGLVPLEVTSLSGVWSFAIASLFLPFDNISESFYMITHSLEIGMYSLSVVVAFAIWSIMSLQVTNKASAVSRMIFDQLTIVVVWVVQLCIYWGVVGTKWEERYKKSGEAWTNWSFLQLFGFIVMIIGACIYQGLVHIKCLGNEELDSSANLLEDDKRALQA